MGTSSGVLTLEIARCYVAKADIPSSLAVVGTWHHSIVNFCFTRVILGCGFELIFCYFRSFRWLPVRRTTTKLDSRRMYHRPDRLLSRAAAEVLAEVVVHRAAPEETEQQPQWAEP